MSNVPNGYCQCGCGQKTAIAVANNKKNNVIKGQSQRYIKGHFRHRSEMERFWEKVDKRSTNECWNWIGAKDADGYGRFRTDRRILNRWAKASRFLYESINGKLPRFLNVCHTCDNRACVNPNHLYAGTQQQNIQDMKDRNRFTPHSKSGEQSHLSKLTAVQVREIRRRAALGESRRILEKEFNISRAQLGAVIRRESWKDV